MVSEQRPPPGSGLAPPAPPLPGVEAPRRGPVFGRRYVVAADHPLASLAAMEVLRSGGNAVDAAIAASAVNCVTKPNRTQLGGDAFALLWHRRTGQVEALNAGGRAPARATPDQFEAGIPVRGPRASTVPGIVDAWVELHRRHGARPLGDLLRPAARLAEEGFPVSLHLAAATAALPETGGEVARLFLDHGRPYSPGDVLRQPELAQTLMRVAAEGRDGFYAGPVASAIAAAMAQAGGLIDAGDLARPAAHWQAPLVSSYRGHTIVEQPLPSQGLVLLQALKIAERFPIAAWGPLSADAVHVMAEATRLAFADARRYAADPEVEPVDVARLLSEGRAAELAARIDLARAGAAAPVPIASDTTSFVVADEDTAVCFIQSVYAVWGSRFAIPGTGVLMNNRLTGFTLEPDSPNRLAPNKRALHTLNNFLVVKDGALIAGGGTPGADYQVQTNLQVIAAVVDAGFDLASAVDAPRWATASGRRLDIETRFAPGVIAGLRSRDHAVHEAGPWGVRACSQVLASLTGGGWAAASDLRGEGLALGA